ncbi:MAG: ClpXP protease specificity-enhancing factor [Halofilum sp. (in: g-proteobacteria)]|nr:ClpXP protease specificity-enhancing factor [Halofilum sp. (in: g-proteobacteria)]
MNSSRPYLLRAIHQWIVDNDCTPYLLVNANAAGVVVPREYIENEKIILNISPTAAHNLALGDEEVVFNARFGGRPMEVVAPVPAVLAIYARENGQGMLFTDEAEGDDEAAEDTDAQDGGAEGEDAEPHPRRPHLRVIK